MVVYSYWRVIGGGKGGGIIVRQGQDVKSTELPERLAKDAVVKQEWLLGDRMRYRKVSGEGPNSGWVSVKFKSSALLVTVPSPLAAPAPSFEELPADTREALEQPLQRALAAMGRYVGGEAIREFQDMLPKPMDPHWGVAAATPEIHWELWCSLEELAKVPGLSCEALVDAGLKTGLPDGSLPYWMWWCKSVWNGCRPEDFQQEEFDPKWCPLRARLTPGKPLPEDAARASARSGAWLVKAGDAQRTGTTPRASIREFGEPRWSFHTIGLSYNTSLVDEAGNVYVSTDLGEVYALAPDGRQRWYYRLFVGFGLSAAANPAIDDGTFFTVDPGGIVYALDCATGHARWVRQVTNRASAGNCGVTAGQGLVITHHSIGETGWTEDGEFVASDAATGEERWRVRVQLPFYNVLMAFSEDRAAVLFTDMDGGAHKHDVKTGQRLWTSPGYPFPLTEEAGWFGGFGGAPRCHGALSLVRDGVFYSSGNPTKTSGRVRAHRVSDGEVIWSTDIAYMMGNAGALADIDGVPTLVVGSGITIKHPMPESKVPFVGHVYGIRADTGDILWTFTTEQWWFDHATGSVTFDRCFYLNLPDAFGGPVVDGNGTAFIGWHGGVLYAIDCRNGELLSSFRTMASQSMPAVGPSGELVVTAAMITYSFWP